jgi:hypothetical protein
MNIACSLQLNGILDVYTIVNYVLDWFMFQRHA